MFDLFRSRATTVRYLLGGLLTLVALSMVTYLIPNYNNQTGTTANPILAEVGGTPIFAQDAQRQFERMTQGQIPPEMREIYFPQILDKMIQDLATVYQAGQMGLTVSDDEVRAGIGMSFATYFKDGKLDRPAFDAVIAKQGYTQQMVIDQIREQLLVRKLQDVILESSIVSPAEVEAEYRKKYEKASVQYIAFASADVRSQVKLTDDEVRQNYEAEKNSYRQPEKYGFRALVLEQEKLAASLQLTEQELRAAYSNSLDNFRVPERMRARHILLSTQGKSDAEKKALLAKAEDLVKQAKGGADFADLAKKNSADSNAAQGGDLGFFPHGQMVPEFDSAAFALKPNEISGVVTTTYGYHVIQALEKEPARIEPFEKVRPDLERELRGQRLVQHVQETADKMRADLIKTPAAAADIAKASGAQLITVQETASGQPIPTLGVSPEVDGSLAGLQPGGVTEVLTLPGDRLVVAVLDRRIPGRPADFEEVKATVRDKMLGERAEKLAQERAKTAAERLRKGEDLAAVAKSMGVTVNSAKTFGREGNVEGIGPAVYLEDAFTKPVGAIIGPSQIQGRNIVAVSTAKVEADMANLDKERDALVLSLKGTKARERNALLMDSIITKLTADGKIVKHQEEIQRTLALYRK